MNQVQSILLKVLGIALYYYAIKAMIHGAGESTDTKNKDQADSMNTRGFKALGAWWTLGAILLAGGTMLTFFSDKVMSVIMYVLS